MAKVTPSAPIQSEADRGRLLHANSSIATSAKHMIEQELKKKGEDETIDNTKFNNAIQQVREMKVNKLNKKLEGELITLIKDKYFSGSAKSAADEKSVLPQAPLRFATVVNDDRNIFNTIARSAQNDTATELVRLLRDEKFDKDTAFKSYRTILVPDSMGLIENVMPTPPPTEESSPAATSPGDASSSPPVVSENCKNLVSRRLGGKKQIEQKEYDELIKEANDDVLGMTKEDVDECLKQNGITILPSTAASSSPVAGPVDLSSFTGRVNLQGNLTITGTLDFSSRTLEITGVAPVSISGTVPGVSVTVPAAASPSASPLSGSISTEEAILENLIDQIKVKGFKGIDSNSVILPSDKDELIEKLKPITELSKKYFQVIALEPSNTESKKRSYSPALSISNPRVSLELSLKKGKDNQWTLDIPKVDSKNLTAPRQPPPPPPPKSDACEKFLEGIERNAIITTEQYIALSEKSKTLGVDRDDCLIKNGNKIDTDEWDTYFKDKKIALPTPSASLMLTKPPKPVSENCKNLVSRRLGGKKQIEQKEYDELIKQANDDVLGMTKEEVDECLKQNEVSIIPSSGQVEELPVPENLITAGDMKSLFLEGGGLNKDNLSIIKDKLSKTKATLKIDHEIDVKEKGYKNILFTSDIHSDLRKFIQTLQQKDLIIYDGDPYSDDIYKPELLETVQWKYEDIILVILGDLVDGQRFIPVDDNAGSFELLLHIFLYNLRLRARQKKSEVLFTIGNHDFNTVIRPDAGMINNYTTANSKTFFGDSRTEALLPFYELSPFIVLQFFNGDTLEIQAIHGGFAIRNKDKTVFLNRSVNTLQSKINNNGFSKLEQNEIALLNDDKTGVLWTREYALDTVKCSDFKEDQPMTIVGHCITRSTDALPRFGAILAKDDKGCDTQENRTSNGCVIVDCEDATKGPKLAFVDTGMSAAFENQASTYNPADRIVEFLWLKRDENLGETPRWFNTIRRIRKYKDTIDVWESPPASSTGGGNKTLTLQYEYYANPIFVHDNPAPTVNRIETFVEKQEGAGCGRHALNNFFGNKVFVKEEDKDVVKDTIEEYGYPVSLQTLCDHLKQVFVGVAKEQNYCPEDENYDHNILEAALQLFGYTTSKNMDGFERINSGIGKLLIPVYIEGLQAAKTLDDGVVGYLVHHPGHWTSIRVDPKSKKPYTFYNSIGSVIMNDSLSNIYKKHLKDANGLFRIKEVFGPDGKTRITKDFIRMFSEASETRADPDSEFDFFATYEEMVEFTDIYGIAVKPGDFVKCKGSKPFKVEGIFKGTSGKQKDNIYVLDGATGYSIKQCEKVEAPAKTDTAPRPKWLDEIKRRLKLIGKEGEYPAYLTRLVGRKKDIPLTEEKRLPFSKASKKLKPFGKDRPKSSLSTSELADEYLEQRKLIEEETPTQPKPSIFSGLANLWKSTASKEEEPSGYKLLDKSPAKGFKPGDSVQCKVGYSSSTSFPFDIKEIRQLVSGEVMLIGEGGISYTENECSLASSVGDVYIPAATPEFIPISQGPRSNIKKGDIAKCKDYSEEFKVKDVIQNTKDKSVYIVFSDILGLKYLETQCELVSSETDEEYEIIEESPELKLKKNDTAFCSQSPRSGGRTVSDATFKVKEIKRGKKTGNVFIVEPRFGIEFPEKNCIKMSSETPIGSITIDGTALSPGSKVYVKKYDRNKCLKPGEAGTVSSISVKTWPNKSQVVVNCVNPSGKTDTYAADQLSPTAVSGPSVEINGTTVTIGSKVYVREAMPERCLEYGKEGTVADIQTSLFGSKTVYVQCETGNIDEYLPEELFTKTPVVEYSRSGVDPLSRKPSTAQITCKDANDADIKAGDKVRGLDFKDGVVVEEVQTRTGNECYVKLKFSDDPLVIRYIRSDTVEKVVEGAPALEINPITQNLINRALERTKQEKQIPTNCKTSNGTRLQKGDIVKALSPSGEILTSTVVQYAPFLRRIGRLSNCDILVRANADPFPQFVVSTSHVEFVSRPSKGGTLRNRNSARQTKRHSAFGGGPAPAVSEKDLLDYDAIYQAIKGDSTFVKTSELQARVKNIIETTGDAGDDVKDTPKVYDTIDKKKYVFGKADAILTSQKLREVSKVGETAIDFFVQKVETIRDALDNHNGKLQREIKNIQFDISRTAVRGERLIKFTVTPLQYAVLVGNRDIITALIANNVPMSETETRTPPSLDKTQYTLEDLATKRKDKDTLRGKGVLQLTQEIKQARRDATEDAEKYPPIKNENYGKDQKGGINETKRLIYLKIFTELMKGKPDIPIDQIKFANEIDMANKDAEAGKPNMTFYKSSIWRERTAPLLGAELAYTRTYDIKRAEIEGARDGNQPNPVKNPEYTKDEYKSQPLAAIKESYMNAFNKASATDFSIGYEDGLKAAPTSGYVSQYSFLEPGLAQLIFGTSGSDKTREQYRLGYVKGLTQLITPNPKPETAKTLDIGYYDTVMDSARKAGQYDATNGLQMYTTPATYKAVDTRSLDTSTISLAEKSQKTIPIEIKLNNLIQNLSSIYLDSTPDEENIRKTQQIQDKINKLKEEYDESYANTISQLSLSRGSPVRPTSTLVSPTGSIPDLKETPKPAEKKSFFRNPFKSKTGGRITKKHYKRSPKRRTLRTE